MKAFLVYLLTGTDPIAFNLFTISSQIAVLSIIYVLKIELVVSINCEKLSFGALRKFRHRKKLMPEIIPKKMLHVIYELPPA